MNHMDEPATKYMHHVGMRKRHYLTGAEIKLLMPKGDGWMVQFVGAPTSPGQSGYMAYLDADTLTRKFVDVVE